MNIEMYLCVHMYMDGDGEVPAARRQRTRHRRARAPCTHALIFSEFCHRGSTCVPRALFFQSFPGRACRFLLLRRASTVS